MATTTIEELARLRRAKAEIKEEIEAKGVEVPSSALLDTYDTYVRQIRAATGPVQWGEIEGELSDQADLQEAFAGVQDALDEKYELPADGIPATDIADGVIPDVSDFITKTVDDLANYYLKSETFTKDEVEALIDAIIGFEYELVSSLPSASADTMHKIYLVPSADPQSENVKDEYITIDNGESAQTRYTWEQIGSTAIDLTGYVTESALNTALASYVLSTSITDVLRYSSQSLTTEQQTQARTNIGAGTYSKPSGGIPSSDMASAVQTSLGKADSAYQKPSGGIPSSDMASAVQTSLGKADSAYQKPGTGIPATDLASAVQTSLGKADTAVQTETDPTVPSWAKQSSKPTYTASEVGALPDSTAIPSDLDDLSDVNLGTPSDGDVLTYDSTTGKWVADEPQGGELSTDVVSDKASNTKASTPKSVYDFVKPAAQISQPAGGMLPGVLYNLGVLTGSVTIDLATPADANVANEYAFTFTAGSTAPTITWPSGILGWAGNCIDSNGVPDIKTGMFYEVSILNGIGAIMEVEI